MKSIWVSTDLLQKSRSLSVILRSIWVSTDLLQKSRSLSVILSVAKDLDKIYKVKQTFAEGLIKFNLEVVIISTVVILAWAIALFDIFIAKENFLNYHILLHAHVYPTLKQLLLLIISWQVMTIAMMLPSNLPLIQLFAQVSRSQPQPVFYLSLLALILAYLSIWTGFALLAFLMAQGLFFLLDNFSGLEGRYWLISGTTLLIAGGFQFSDLKQRCLKVCRHPLSFLHHHYQRGIKAAWNLGINHGLYCLGCCWALMLLMFVTGVGHKAIMLLLTGIMTIEKTSPRGQTLVPIVGIALIFSGLVTLIRGAVYG